MLPLLGDAEAKLKESFADDLREAEARFHDEARVSLLLDHPAICRTIDAGRVDDASYLAFDLVEGIDLGHLVDRAARAQRPIDETMALLIAAHVLDALAYAHTGTR